MFFGPVFYYDVVRLARRGRYALVRGLYGACLAGLLFIVYLQWAERSEGGKISAREMADFAESFFMTLLCVQLAAAVLLTPAYVAGAVAEEKERRTLEFLLATDLRDREIVLGKLASRLANLVLLLLTGLPVLSMLQVLGGVAPELLLAGFAATGVTLLGVGGLSMLNSVLARRARDAVIQTYAAGAAYLVLAALSFLLLEPDLGLADFPSTDQWTSPVTVKDLVEGFNAGNIFYALSRLGTGTNLYDELGPTLRNYVLFHAAVCLVCTGWAVRRVRRQALREAGRAGPRDLPGRSRGSARRGFWRRPPVGDRPMVWKETYVDSGARHGWFHRVVLFLLVAGSFVPAVIIAYTYLVLHGTASREEFTVGMGWMARIVGTVVVCLTLLGIAVRASGSITGERERQTLDGLLTTPMDSEAILFGKWLGSILSQRWAWAWAGVIVGLGVVSGGVSLLAVPLLLFAWAGYAAFMASLGVWYSITARTSMRANLATVGTAAAAAFGHWFVWTCCGACVLGGLVGATEWAEWIGMFQAFGLTPPLTLGLLAFQGWEFGEGFLLPGNDRFVGMILCALVGVTLYALAAFVLWSLASRRFRVLSGRTDRLPPRRPPDVAVPVRETRPPTD